MTKKGLSVILLGLLLLGLAPLKVCAAVPGTVKWKYSLTSNIGSLTPPALGGAGIVIASYSVYSFDLNGNKIWEFVTGGQVNGAPVIAKNGNIYVATVVGAYSGKVFALSGGGTKLWEFNPNYPVKGGLALGADGTIYVAANQFYALNPDGTMKWSFWDGYSFDSGQPVIAADGTIYVGTLSGRLYALGPDGKKKWAKTIGNSVWGPMVSLDQDGTIYCWVLKSGYISVVKALRSDGTEKWEFQPTGQPGGYVSQVIVGRGALYVGGGDNLFYALDSKTGKASWTFPASGRPLYATGDIVYVAAGNFFAVDAITHQELWCANVGAPTMCTYPVLGGDVIYVGSNGDSSLYAVNCRSGALAGPWPMFQHDVQHTGRGPGGGSSTGAQSLLLLEN